MTGQVMALVEAHDPAFACRLGRLKPARWAELSQGGEPGQCGWLKDRFGISWQVVPEAWLQWLGSDADDGGRERVLAAMQGMSKLDVGALERAFAGD